MATNIQDIYAPNGRKTPAKLLDFLEAQAVRWSGQTSGTIYNLKLDNLKDACLRTLPE